MITRDLASVNSVHAFDQQIFHSCTVSGFTCTCAGPINSAAGATSYPGRLIDRLGLSRRYAAVKVAVAAYGDIQCSAGSTAMTNYMGLAVGLQHSATTCSGDFTDYSTGDWGVEEAFQVATTSTSTSAWAYSAQQLSAVAAGVLTTALTTSTSTGYASFVGTGQTAIPLTGAKRFLRVVVAPHIETTGCGGSNMKVSAVLIFGSPEEAPVAAPLGRVHVTSACST